MVYRYAVKHNGIIYPAGTDVPVGDNKIEKKVEVKPTEKAEEKPIKAKRVKAIKKDEE